MTIKAKKFTPEVLLSAPRRSAGVPNATATKVLYSVSIHSFEEQKTTSEIRILDVVTQQSIAVTTSKEASDPKWLDDETVLLLNSIKGGKTEVLIGKADEFEKRQVNAPTMGGF
jgi:hypothetical protein